ncbi:MAG: heme biosynthesis protein HemY [Cereibacter sphaeroides]|uniref:Heme biosynthesis protein HemY n=1 Tax=Cereibacter sphaeroides TaxID=1063 RepID=A0A2W5S7C3_CERSP|nr:MAG: heme biosynthesis protein HemY [Cereibacter sphaeroides]
MIWSLIKVLVFVAVVAAMTIGASYLLEAGGGVRIAAWGYEFTLGPLQALIIALVLLGLLWLVMKIVGLTVAVLRFLNGDETAISRYFNRNRERKGYQAFAEGMIALASGEPRTALSRASRAEKYLARPELTTILTAQAAQAAGDTRRATDAYKTLLADPASRFIGIRGLIQQKLAEGDRETALKLAQKAFELKPKHQETQDLLLELQAESSDWVGARATLGAKLRSGAIPRDVHKRRDAVLALQEARSILGDGSDIDAREAAIAANKQSPDLIPAATMAARGYIAKGDTRNAARILKKAWEANPHPDLAAAFAEIVPVETPAERLKRFRTLTSIRSDDDETRMLLAELNLAAEDFPEARRALGDLVTRHPTRRSLAIMAAIERGEGSDEAVVRGWLARTLTAPRGPQWVCDKCHSIHSEWTPVCSNCGGFDTLTWREPTEKSGPSATQSELLPLLVGTRPPETSDST